jgi:tetraacyldisaccharide 4'-kinase
LAAEPKVDLLISDDGLQQPSLPRAVAVVVFDSRGAGNGRLLPAGPLREPMPQEPSPRTLVLYNAPAPSTVWPGLTVQRSLTGAVALQDWWTGKGTTLAHLHAFRSVEGGVIAAAGIGDPQRFFRMLADEGLQVQPMPLRDHAALRAAPWPPGARPILVTEKDAVKLPASHPDAARIHVVTLDCPWPSKALETLMTWLPAPPPSHPRADEP